MTTLFQQSSFANEDIQVLIFTAEIVDTSLEGELFGENPDQVKRLQMITHQLKAEFESRPGYQVAHWNRENTDVLEIIKRERYLHDCNNCDLSIGRKLGVDWVIAVWVQKVSNLILNLNLVIRNVHTGETEKSLSVDIRSNTDKSWQRGMAYLIKNYLFHP